MLLHVAVLTRPRYQFIHTSNVLCAHCSQLMMLWSAFKYGIMNSQQINYLHPKKRSCCHSYKIVILLCMPNAEWNEFSNSVCISFNVLRIYYNKNGANNWRVQRKKGKNNIMPTLFEYIINFHFFNHVNLTQCCTLMLPYNIFLNTLNKIIYKLWFSLTAKYEKVDLNPSIDRVYEHCIYALWKALKEK